MTAGRTCPLICDLPAGGRCYALLDGDAAALGGAETEELIGRTVTLAPADGINHARLREHGRHARARPESARNGS